jgi:2-dehydro-3-deoxygalactonokinase
MTWRGEIIGENRTWGAEDALRVFVVGARGVPDDAATGPVLPERMPGTDGALHLPALGAIGAADRLALIGFQSLNPDWDGVAVVVGEVATIWATCSAREVIHQQGSAVPEMVSSLGLAKVAAEGFAEAQDRPERLPMLLHDAAGDAARLGVLIGADIGAARRLWLGQQVVLIGAGALARGYGAALAEAGVPLTRTDHAALLTKGFEALAQAFPAAE